MGDDKRGEPNDSLAVCDGRKDESPSTFVEEHEVTAKGREEGSRKGHGGGGAKSWIGNCSQPGSLLPFLFFFAFGMERTSDNIANGSGVGKDVEDIFRGLLLIHHSLVWVVGWW